MLVLVCGGTHERRVRTTCISCRNHFFGTCSYRWGRPMSIGQVQAFRLPADQPHYEMPALSRSGCVMSFNFVSAWSNHDYLSTLNLLCDVIDFIVWSHASSAIPSKHWKDLLWLRSTSHFKGYTKLGAGKTLPRHSLSPGNFVLFHQLRLHSTFLPSHINRWFDPSSIRILMHARLNWHKLVGNCCSVSCSTWVWWIQSLHGKRTEECGKVLSLPTSCQRSSLG